MTEGRADVETTIVGMIAGITIGEAVIAEAMTAGIKTTAMIMAATTAGISETIVATIAIGIGGTTGIAETIEIDGMTTVTAAPPSS